MPDSSINPGASGRTACLSAVDIIIPAHHAASTLAPCLDSILAQSFEDWRAIVIINQRGYDATMGIAGKYAGADPRITVRYLQRGDLSSAVNYGVSVSGAPYIAMLDADDEYDPRFLELALDALRVTGADMALSDILRFEDESELQGAIESNAQAALDVEIQRGDEKYEFMKRNPISGVLRSNRVYARKVLEGVWYPSGRIHEDEYAIYDVLHNCESAAHVKAPLYYYRKTPGSITSASNPREMLDEARALSHRVHSAARNGDCAVATQALKKMAMDCAFRYTSYDDVMRRDERTGEAFRVVRRDLRAYGNCLSAAERVRLGVILARPEAVNVLVPAGKTAS
ncbi:glycosyltransferase family 2 protein [Anaerolactibacter massiliensis]|uniref:glycosyltransferase family 2 protein n=1 Tax=Anaerolactibacter massiliensis TaxID=2044573 RepID=UPI0014354E09|nr:glycosyltransferase family 2 protein [Anaerolactibacter massiliensis]